MASETEKIAARKIVRDRVHSVIMFEGSGAYTIMDGIDDIADAALEAAEHARWQQAERKVTDRLDRVIFDQANSIRDLVAERDAAISQAKVAADIMRRSLDELRRTEKERGDAIAAATIKRCIEALKKLTGRTRGPIIEEAIGIIRALAKAPESE